MNRRWAWAVGAAFLWLTLCLRWFDVGAAWRPRAFLAVPPIALLAALLATLVGWARVDRGQRSARPRDVAGLLLVVLVAFAFRLPFVVQGSAGAVTPDGALSGIVALHARDGVEHLVFVPHVPYSGSLKSHLTAPLTAVLDPARAFALVSVLFYLAYVAGVFALALRVEGGSVRLARAAGLFAAVAPAFVTRYSVSNDGNYVEVLALGAWALVLAADGMRAPFRGFEAPLAIGLLLGLAFWCHILALVPMVAIGAGLLMADARRTARSAPMVLAGLVLGYAPGLLWNGANGWESFRYLLPGGTGVGDIEKGPGLAGRLAGMVTGQWPVLMGYDPGHSQALDVLLLAGGWLAVCAALYAVATTLADAARTHAPILRTLLVWAAVNVGLAGLVLPLVDGNPRYLLFLMVPLPVLLARALGAGPRRYVLAAIVSLGAIGSVAQLPGTMRADRQWREFVDALRAEGVHHCFTDFFLATKINFLSAESVVCSAKLGPTTTEYFFPYRTRVEGAPSAALVAVNAAHAEKLERRLGRLGVTYERRDLMKPVLLRLSRKVDPQELFPDRTFPWR